MLDLPGEEKGVFMRTLRLGPSSDPLMMLLCETAEGFPLRIETKRIAPGETNTWTIEIDGTEGSIAFTTKHPKTLRRMDYAPGAPQAWSVLDLGLIIVATFADGGASSPLTLLLFMPVVFASLSYPRASVLAVGTISVAGYLALALTMGGSSWGYEELFAVMLGCTCAMSSWPGDTASSASTTWRQGRWRTSSTSAPSGSSI